LSLSSAIEDIGNEATTEDNDDDRKHNTEDLASAEFLVARSTTVRRSRENRVLGIASLILSSVLSVNTPGAVAIVSMSATITVSVFASKVSRTLRVGECLASLSCRSSFVEATSGSRIIAPTTSIRRSTRWAIEDLCARDLASHRIVE